MVAVHISKHSLFRLKITVGCRLCAYPSIHFSLDEDTLKITVGCRLCCERVCVHLVWWRVCMYMWRCVYMLCCVLCCGVVLWCCGVVVLWCCGVVVLWCCVGVVLCGVVVWYVARLGARKKKTPRVHVQLVSVCTFKMPPCVLPRHPHVEHIRAFCRYTQKAF